MATSTNVYVLTEKPPTLGRIDGKRAGEQIQEFLRELAKYTRLHVRDGVQIPPLNKLMEEEDLEMLRVVMTGLFEEDDLALHPDDYRILETPRTMSQMMLRPWRCDNALPERP